MADTACVGESSAPSEADTAPEFVSDVCSPSGTDTVRELCDIIVEVSGGQIGSSFPAFVQSIISPMRTSHERVEVIGSWNGKVRAILLRPECLLIQFIQEFVLYIQGKTSDGCKPLIVHHMKLR